MATPYVGEIKLFGGTFAISGWVFCYGQLLPIAQYQTLYQLIGTTYGGDGVTTFGVPDMRGRVALGMGQGLGLTNRVIGERAGTESVTLTTGQLPAHAHPVLADTTQGNVTPPGPTVIPSTAGDPGSLPSLYVVPGTSAITPTAMAAGSIGNTGGNGAHENRMPSLALNYLIAVDGVFPSQS